MNKKAKWILMLIGIFLVFNGFLNIVDDGRVLVYDLTSICSGMGFIVISKTIIK